MPPRTPILRSAFRALDLKEAGRWIIYGILVGVVSGLGASAFFWLVEWAGVQTFDHLAGRPLAAPSGEKLFHHAEEAPREFKRWVFFFLPVAGGLVSGILVFVFAPEAEGHGTDALIDAFHTKRGNIRTRVPIVKGLATVATLAGGGSAGREGPIAQIGAGFGSWLARLLRLKVRTRRMLLLAGTAGGLGAIFRAPLGGAMTSIEVLYREDFESEALVPCIISSVTGFATFAAIFGYQSIFLTPPMEFKNLVELPFYACLAVLCMPVGILYVKLFYGIRDRVFRRIPLPKWLLPAVGGLGVGLIGLAVPEIYGSGWGQIELAMFGKLSLGFMALLIFLKILATSLTIGSGGSGGVFGPTLFIGAMLGGAFGFGVDLLFPGLISQPGAFVLVGMAAFFAGVANAPIGALLMVCELTGDYGLVAPLMLVCVLSLLFTRRWSIYQNQVRDKFHSPAHIGDLTVDLLEELQVREAFRSRDDFPCVAEDDGMEKVRDMITETDESHFAVIDENREVTGMLPIRSVRPVIFSDRLDSLILVEDLAIPTVTISPDATLHDALTQFHRTRQDQVFVIDDADPRKVLGTLRHEDLMKAYHDEVTRRHEDEREE